ADHGFPSRVKSDRLGMLLSDRHGCYYVIGMNVIERSPCVGICIEFGGKSFAPLYTPKNDTLINLFQISQQEQEQLKTIISTDEAQKRRRERDRLRDEERRRAAGQLEREAYEANSLSRQKPWEAMGMSRAKWYRLGKPSPQQNSETSPSPITNGEASAVALQAARCKAV
ncbi:hypothetical protein OGX85_25790, partial [Serratia marcescens]|nr:hypothetical protein [Serratia marcescens]